MQHRFDMIPDLANFKDHTFSIAAPHYPASYDLSRWQPPVLDQGEEGSCTAHGGAGLMAFLAIKSGKPYTPLSRQQLYYSTRALEGTVREDSGAQLRDVIKALNKTGMAPELLWPYTEPFTKKPTAKVLAAAALNRAAEYQRVAVSVTRMKDAIVNGFPVLIGITVFDSFESDAVAASGIVPMPLTTEASLGGHCMYAFGYDDSKRAFLVRNSWGESWGIEGNCWIPYDYLGSTDYGSDYWVVRGLLA